ncbi:glutamate decarboxylase [Streptomyces sp. AS58]|uniref:Glutamate decarboxylase n=1 Tax=Streptomyces cadmiisoli TaxID=2184053 RepID=A0A2Z4IUZ6_9ACTN|nr:MULTISPECIES: glutamate decarboxylase [Streptomyces]AWW36594.1 glutamate decarboxylase [Streptomyces cadmiisoli]KOV52774.1 glutamate decarboxylase [Streptomyces sp. AS58]
MALHQTNRPTAGPFDDVYALPISARALPKYRMPDKVSDARAVRALIHDELGLDGNASQNLATFCTTWAEPEVHSLMDECLGKNMIDKDEYPQTAEIESRCVHMLADLWNSPDGATTLGCSTTGSSEASMLGGLALKWRWRARRRAEGKPTDRPNLVVGPVQVCWEKFARYFDVELRQVPLEKDAVGLRPHQLREYVDENTIGVVAILGVTYTCVYEPVAGIAAELDRIQADTGLDIPVHVDAASGGFVAPFLHPELVWDFRLPRVASINASGHKYGMAPLGVGWVVWRSADLLPEDLVFRVSYLGGDMPTFALNFSRPGGEVVAQYYNLLRLGREGYTKVHGACAGTARMLAGEVAGMGPFTVLYDGQTALPAVTWTLTDDAASPFTLYDVSDQLRRRGWQVPAYPLALGREDTVVQRVLVRHGTSYDKIALLASDLRTAVGLLSRGQTGHVAEQPGFHH